MKKVDCEKPDGSWTSRPLCALLHPQPIVSGRFNPSRGQAVCQAIFSVNPELTFVYEMLSQNKERDYEKGWKRARDRSSFQRLLSSWLGWQVYYFPIWCATLFLLRDIAFFLSCSFSPPCKHVEDPLSICYMVQKYDNTRRAVFLYHHHPMSASTPAKRSELNGRGKVSMQLLITDHLCAPDIGLQTTFKKEFWCEDILVDISRTFSFVALATTIRSIQIQLLNKRSWVLLVHIRLEMKRILVNV